MACFLVSAAEAAIVTVATQLVLAHENKLLPKYHRETEAAGNPADTAVMLHEMSTVGVTMAVLVTAVWVGLVLVSSAMEKKALLPAVATK